ncbi:AAA family ATPase [Tabrizicola thermarum]|uniref:AAA family ATPase n=1 Tax=Tabrizicola thermarum TaxID=2670345 RepID=UPI000FFBC55D
MYISQITLRDWKAYTTANFDFPAPGKDRNIILIGAPNGYGKTSLFEAIVLTMLRVRSAQRCHFRCQFHLDRATGVEVFRSGLGFLHFFEGLKDSALTHAGREVRRISTRRDRFRASWRVGRLSAPPA